MEMKSLGLIVPYDYKLLSIAAILDVFETVNRIYLENKRALPFSIRILQTPEQIEQGKNLFLGHSVESIYADSQFSGRHPLS
jgi:hypothetical protein